MGRIPYGCDINPLSPALCEPRLIPRSIRDVEHALAQVDFRDVDELPEDLLVFYHPETLQQICALRKHLAIRGRTGRLTVGDKWVQMVALNRLTGHSPGFFSVYTLPLNQAVSVKAQAKINAKRDQAPPLRDVRRILAKKPSAAAGRHAGD